MKKHYLRVLSATFALAAFAISAKAQSVDRTVVKIPYDFVVDGHTLPAGNYTVSRLNNRDQKELVISSFENHKTVYVLSSEVEDKDSGQRPSFDFQLVGDQHVLDRIETAEHVFSIPVSPATLRQIARRNSSDAPAAGMSDSK